MKRPDFVYGVCACMNKIYPQQTTCCGLLFFSIIYHYYLYQYYLSQLLQYTPKECVQKSKACLYVGPLQVLKSIMAIWLYLLCISQHNMLIKSHALSLNQKGEKLVHGITFDVEPSEKSSSNLLRTLCKWTHLWSFSLFF